MRVSTFFLVVFFLLTELLFFLLTERLFCVNEIVKKGLCLDREASLLVVHILHCIVFCNNCDINSIKSCLAAAVLADDAKTPKEHNCGEL